MSIPLEKVLSIGAIEYARMTGSSLRDYVPHGVCTDRTCDRLHDVANALASRAPSDTEVIVNFTCLSPSSNSFHGYGTALVRKKK